MSQNNGKCFNFLKTKVAFSNSFVRTGAQRPHIYKLLTHNKDRKEILTNENPKQATFFVYIKTDGTNYLNSYLFRI